MQKRYTFVLFQITELQSTRYYAQHHHLTISNVKERVKLVLQLYDKVDPEKVHSSSNLEGQYKIQYCLGYTSHI